MKEKQKYIRCKFRKPKELKLAQNKHAIKCPLSTAEVKKRLREILRCSFMG